MPEFIDGLSDGRLFTLADTRYFLLAPPHHVLTPRFVEFALSIDAAGYIPILPHPERLGWADVQYEIMRSLAEAGVLRS